MNALTHEMQTGLDKREDRVAGLPLKGGLAPVYAGSLLIAILMAVVSVAGVGYRSLIYPTEALRQAFVANDVVNLVVGLPISLGSMWLAWRGRLIGLLCWPGALFFILYTYTAYVLAMPFGWALLLHIALMMLSAYALIGLVAAIDGKAVQQRLSGAVPERLAGGILAGLGLLFWLRAIGVLVNGLLTGAVPAETELAVNIADFLTTPVWVIGGLLLWRRSQFGYVAGLGLLFQGSMLFVALVGFLLLQPILTDAPQAVVDIAVIAVMGLVCFVPFALFARGVAAPA